MRVLFLPESTSASVAILTRYPAGTLVRFTTVNMHKESTTCIFLIVKYWTPVDTSGAETELFRSNYVTNIAADAQTPCIDRSATMVLSFYGRQVLIVPKEGFSLYLLSKKYRNWYKCKYRFMFLKMKLSRPGLKPNIHFHIPMVDYTTSIIWYIR